MTRDEIMLLVNETAPRYQSWGIEAHFQAFAKRLLEIEREACAKVCEVFGQTLEVDVGPNFAEAIRARGGDA